MTLLTLWLGHDSISFNSRQSVPTLFAVKSITGQSITGEGKSVMIEEMVRINEGIDGMNYCTISNTVRNVCSNKTSCSGWERHMWLHFQALMKTLGRRKLYWDQIWTGWLDFGGERVDKSWINVHLQCISFLDKTWKTYFAYFHVRTFGLHQIMRIIAQKWCTKHHEPFTRLLGWSHIMPWPWFLASWMGWCPAASVQLPTQTCIAFTVQ